MKNVLIVSYSFPPLQNIAAQRYGQMAPFMEENGWSPSFITTRAVGDLTVTIDEKRIFRVGEALQPSPKVSLSRKPALSRHLDYVREFLTSRNFRFRSFDSSMFTWYKQVKSRGNDIIKAFPKVDLVVASFPPAASLWLGRLFSMFYDVPWIADFRDLGALRPDGRNALSIFIDRNIERRLLDTVHCFFTVSEVLANILKKQYKKPCNVIYNGWSYMNHDSVRIPHKKPYILYAGRLYLHQMPSFILLLKALKLVEDIDVNFRSLGPIEREHEILETATKFGIGDRVLIMPPVSQEAIAMEAQNAYCNLVLEDLSTRNIYSKGTLTGKFCQFLPITPPILSIARYDNEMGLILKETSKGALCSSVNEIAFFLELIKNDSSKFTGNADKIAKYSKKSQAIEFCRILDAVC